MAETTETEKRPAKKIVGYSLVLRWQHKSWVYFATNMPGILQFLKEAFEKDIELPKLTKKTVSYIDSRGKLEVAKFDDFASMRYLFYFLIEQHGVADTSIQFGPVESGQEFQKVNAHTLFP